MEEYKAKVIVQGETDGAVASLKNLKDETTKAKKATDELDRSQSSLSDKLDNLDNKFSSFAGTIGKVGNVLGAAGLVGMVGSAVAALGEMADHAAKVDGVNQGLKISLDEARKSTLGMVSDFNLASAANKAIQLGVVKNSQEFAKLAEVAGKLGMAMGQDVTQSVEDLTTGIGRQSFEILDNLGIMIKAEEAYDLYAQRIGKVASELTDAEKKQAFMTIALERAEQAADKSGVTLDTNVNRVQRVKAAWENFTDALSVGFFNAAGGALELMDNLSARSTILEEIAKRQAEIAAQQEAMRKDMSENLNPIIAKGIEDAKSLLNLAGEEMKAAIAAEETYQRQQKALADTMIGPMPAEKKKKGAGKEKIEDLSAASMHRARDFDGTDASKDLAIDLERRQDATANEAIQANITDLEHELDLLKQRRGELEKMMEDTPSFWFSENKLQEERVATIEDLTNREIAIEEQLVEAKRAAAQSRNEILEVEVERRIVADKRANLNMTKMFRSEEGHRKRAEQAMITYQGALLRTVDAIGKGIEAHALGQEKGFARTMYAFTRSLAVEMGLTSAKEAVLAIIAAASYRYPEAAAHGAAAAAAGALAGIAGGTAFGIGNTLTSAQRGVDMTEPPATTARNPGDGRGEKGGSSGKGDDDGVPTSYYDADLWTKRPDKGRNEERNGGGINISDVTVLGATKEEVGQALDKLIRDSQRSLGRNTVRK